MTATGVNNHILQRIRQEFVERTFQNFETAAPLRTETFDAQSRNSTMNEGLTPEKAASGGLKYSTTSSVYAEHSIVNPNYDQVLFCVAALLQAQIFEDAGNSDMRRDKFPEFNVMPKLPPELGGEIEKVPESVLNHETMNDTELREKIICGDVPTVDTIFRFINVIYERAKYSSVCNIIALIYCNRLTSAGEMALTMKNWRGLWVSSIIVAQKVWDDHPLKTSAFAELLPSITRHELRELERVALKILDYSTSVKPSLYVKYYFELRELFNEITGSDPQYVFNLQPLSVVESIRLEMKSDKTGQEYKSSSAFPFSASASASNTPNTVFPNMLSRSQTTPVRASKAAVETQRELAQKVSASQPYESATGAKAAIVVTQILNSPIVYGANTTYEDVTFRKKHTRFVLS